MDHTKGGVDPALFTFVGSSHQMVEAAYLRHGMKERLDKATLGDTDHETPIAYHMGAY